MAIFSVQSENERQKDSMLISRIKGALRHIVERNISIDKYNTELMFWSNMLIDLTKWYQGNIPELFGTKPPKEHERVRVNSLQDSAVLSWLELHQKQKYLHDLELHPNVFSGQRLLDIGAGPIPSALCFVNSEIYCLDPLYEKYKEIGYKLHYYENVNFVQSFSENIPIEDNFFDAVISVNSLDHVDDLEKTSCEIKRVLKKDGKLAIHVHYHQPTEAEPIKINDEIIKKHFCWCINLTKIRESQKKMGFCLSNDTESYALWKNFDIEKSITTYCEQQNAEH